MCSVVIPLVPNPEAELVRRLLQREHAAMRVFYDRYAPRLYRVIRELVPRAEEAEDVLQESLVKIWSNVAQYDAQRGRLYTWAVTICRHQATDHRRAARTRGAHRTTSLTEAPAAHRQSAGAYRPEHLDVYANLRWLRFDYHRVLDLHYFQGYSQAEIAGQLDLPLGTIKTHCRQAVQQLAQLYRVQLGGAGPRRKKSLPAHCVLPHCH